MLKPNFTPGPWALVAGDDYYIHADAYPKQFSGHYKGDDLGPALAIIGNRSVDMGTANANLIAAAPELYSDALDSEHAYSWLMQELRDLQHDGASWPAEKIGLFADSLIAYCDAHQIGTRAALAKADGKEA